MKKTMLISGLSLVVSLAMAIPSYAEVEGIKSSDQILAELKQTVKTISTEELKKEIEEDPDLVLVDIRTPTEIANMGGTIQATQNVNIVRGWLEFKITGIAQSKDTPIVVYCGGGLRSPMAADTLMKMGYTNVKDYNEGFLGWKKAGLPISKK